MMTDTRGIEEGIAAVSPASRPYHVVVNWTELLKR
jgi:hypothetical protein